MTTSQNSSEMPVTVKAVPIELCQLLKFGGLVESGGAAKQVISVGEVKVNGIVETQKRKKILVGDRVEYQGQTLVVRVIA